MALRPDNGGAGGGPNVIETRAAPQTSRTYDLFDAGMRATIDGEAAVRQAIRKALITARYTFLIYNSDYGCELDTLIGQRVNSDLFDAEVVRLTREALIYDDRIASVDDFAITRSGDAVYVSMRVTTAAGLSITEEVTLGV